LETLGDGNLNNNDYQAFVDQVWVSDKKDFKMQLAIAGLGLGGEAGESTEYIKKFLRGSHKELHVDDLKDELGDVLYYIGKIANLTGLTLDEIQQHNVDKLTARYLKRA
jgi:NTP pyrophosphatase (non-canonical NTP hydrolase)